MRDFKDLIAWQKAMDLVERVYQLSKRFPREEMYGLTSQIRRAGVSVPSNIAEGHRRRSTDDFQYRLNVALGSLGEIETQTLLAQRLGYVTAGEVEPVLSLAGEVARIAYGLKSSLRPHSKRIAHPRVPTEP